MKVLLCNWKILYYLTRFTVYRIFIFGRRALDIPGLLLPEKLPQIPLWTHGLVIQVGLGLISGSLV
jgi:hypothetical protein